MRSTECAVLVSARAGLRLAAVVRAADQVTRSARGVLLERPKLSCGASPSVERTRTTRARAVRRERLSIVAFRAILSCKTTRQQFRAADILSGLPPRQPALLQFFQGRAFGGHAEVHASAGAEDTTCGSVTKRSSRPAASLLPRHRPPRSQQASRRQ